jgi:hypothetical protein
MRQKRVNRKRKTTIMPKVLKKKKKPTKRRRPKSMKRMDVKVTLFK